MMTERQKAFWRRQGESRWQALTDGQLSEAAGITYGYGRPIKLGAPREYLVVLLIDADEQADAAS